ncbi:MAG: hypothetical protein HYX92_02310 [Chloroflexi bacterium]|nr:hypothetical protein [Chloroflexota bacterium]
MVEKMIEVEHRPGEELVLRFRPPSMHLVPPEAKVHIKAAQKEFLLALRSLLDAAIECMDKADKPKARGRTKIEVE